MNDVHERLLTFLKQYSAKSYKKGEIILFQGEAPRTAYAVKRGIVKAYNISSTGDEKPIGFIGPDSVYPAAWVFGHVPSAVFYYEAFTDVEIYAVPPDEYLEYIKKDPELLFFELDKYVTEDLGKTMRLNALQHSRASDKLIYTLHYLALSHGHVIDQQIVEIGLTLTHQDFANLTGLTRETTATELNKLKSLGVVNYGKHTPYKVNILKLRTILNDQFLAELKPNWYIPTAL